jgi:hypothetical protein
MCCFNPVAQVAASVPTDKLLPCSIGAGALSAMRHAADNNDG